MEGVREAGFSLCLGREGDAQSAGGAPRLCQRFGHHPSDLSLNEIRLHGQGASHIPIVSDCNEPKPKPFFQMKLYPIIFGNGDKKQ